MKSMLNVYCLQLDIIWEAKKENCLRASKILKSSKIQANSLIVLPELFATGFTMNTEKSLDSDSSVSAFLQEQARTFSSWILAGLARKNGSEVENQAVLFAPDGTERLTYAKQRLFSPAAENKHYSPGKKVETIELEEFSLAPFICYDLRFPELFRAAVKDAAEVFVVIASWPAKRSYHWQLLLKARAIENQAYVIGVNRCGIDPDNKYDGQSAIVDPQGNLLAEAGAEEQVLHGILNREFLLSCRQNFPALDDML